MSNRIVTLPKVISIHAPREGCDGLCRVPRPRRIKISIHAPREGCDELTGVTISSVAEFQSTHPVRGATSAG